MKKGLNSQLNKGLKGLKSNVFETLFVCLKNDLFETNCVIILTLSKRVNLVLVFQKEEQ